jgi:outer membrane protein assembly factor BamA
VVSAVAELTPDKQDFIITYVVEEGQRYKFGDVKVKSELRDFDGERLTKMLPMKKGDWYNAKRVEDTVDQLNETAACSAMPSPMSNPISSAQGQSHHGPHLPSPRRRVSMSNGSTSTATR